MNNSKNHHPSTPSLLRRLACFIYEGVLLFGVLMISGYLYSSLTQQRHALEGRGGLMFFLFLVLGIYFVGFWTRGGQTVAMKAWHIRLVSTNGASITQMRAFIRYVLAWLWFMPALVVIYFAKLNSAVEIFTVLGSGVLAYALLAKLNQSRQFWHDMVCGTQLIHAPAVINTRTRSSQFTS